MRTPRRCLTLAAAAGLSASAHAQVSGFPAVIELSGLDGTTGFRLDGIDAGDRSGRSVASAGDVNGDGVSDLVVGAHYADPDERSYGGETYIVFGRRTGFPASIQFSSLNGTTGFRLDGIDSVDFSGFSVASAGDVNGDGVGDIVVGALFADPGGRFNSGETYVVFGRRTGFPASIALSSLDGTTGFRLDGIDADDQSGVSVASAGDLNGDGVGDLVIGANGADPGGRSLAGETYVVFGRRTGFPASIQLSSLDGTSGFHLDGIDAEDVSGRSVASAGDVNGDGIGDLIVGAYRADPGGRGDAGETYVVFGRRTGFPASIALASLDGTTGFRLDGVDAGDRSGFSVASAGDVNGDGIGDLVIGAFGADPGGRSSAGETYVVFGRRTGFPVSVALSSLDGTTGFRLDGIDTGDYSGGSVASTGDINGDGVSDLVLGAHYADPGGRSSAGEAYVVFGRRTGFPASIPLASLDGATGFRLDGIDGGDSSGLSVASAGDTNGDGLSDLIIGAPSADPSGGPGAGETYVVFGRRTGSSCPADFNRDGTVDSDDFFDFLNAFNIEHPSADFNRDGTVDSDDFFDFLNAFNTGC